MKKADKIRLYYGIFLGVFTVVVGVLFIVQAALIYYGGDDSNGKNYTRELVGEKLKQILIPVCFWIAAIIAGFVLSVVFPEQEQRLKAKMSAGETVSRLRRRLPEGALTEEGKQAKKYYYARWGARLAALAVCLAAAIASIVYLFQPVHFPAEDINHEILVMLKNVLPWVGVAFAACCGAVTFDYYMAKRELGSVKQLLATKSGVPKNSFFFDEATAAVDGAVAKVKPHSKWILLGVRLAVLVLGVTFVLLGIFNGGATDVLIKAINICTECIGLG